MNILIKSHDDSNFSLQFLDGFSTPVLNAVRNVAGRRWDNDNRIWLIPDNQNAADQLLQNIYVTGLFNLPQEEIKAPQFEDSFIKREIKKVVDALSVRHYSEHTKQSYKKWVQKFLEIYHDAANPVGEVQINAFLKDLALKKHVSASTQKRRQRPSCNDSPKTYPGTKSPYRKSPPNSQTGFA